MGRRPLVLRLGVAVLLLVVALVAWRLLPRRAGLRREPGMSVLLVSIDTLRADALGCYGRAMARTPWIDRLAAAGVRFTEAHAHNVVTLPSHANILSGRYPYEHGIRDNSGFRFPGDMDTLATILKGAGYRTGAFVSAFTVDSRFGLDRGFEVYDDRYGDPEGRGAFLVQERPGPQTVAAALAWLLAAEGPRFAFVHLFEPHFPYGPPEPFASLYPDEPYQGEVAAADAALEPLLRPLLEQGPAGHTLVVLTADHGESLGDHGEQSHGVFAYEATLHVPLLLFAPRLLEPRVVASAVRHVDILPTVLDALALPVPAGLPGRSLLSLAAGGGDGKESEPSYFEALSTAANRGWAPLYGLLRFPLKYVDLPIPELYDLASDPREQRNLAASRPGDLERLRERLRMLRAGDRGADRAPESAETLERLRALGYVAAPTAALKERYTEDDDPKRLIALDAAIHEVTSRYGRGDLDGAISLCRDVVARRPMPVSLVHLAFLLREKGDLEGAVAAGRRAVEINPRDAEAAALLGGSLNDAGRPRQTAELLRPYAEQTRPDLDVLMAYGAALGQLGRGREALAVFARARQIDPTHAMTLVNIGTVHLLKRDFVEARRAFEAALELDPMVARAHNSLGVVAAETGHPDAAIESWKRAVELNPREWETLYNLGVVLRRQGRDEEARPYLERFVRGAPRGLYGRDTARVEAWLRPGAK
jgi:arylsulfatase A-like enzyme/Flp pilus assembly protein TadD